MKARPIDHGPARRAGAVAMAAIDNAAQEQGNEEQARLACAGILDSGDEAFAVLTKFVNDEKMSAASLTAIGAFERATIGWFDLARATARSRSTNNARC
jgi:predicted DNA-binding protein with PD1-like motif